MLGTRITIGKKLKDEAEKPFWISFADLMTALMVMFLLVMSVALLAVTKTVSEEQRAADARKEAIEKLLDKVEQATQKDPQFSGIHVNRDRQTVDFGDRARFDTASHQLNKDQARLLRTFIPHVLEIANSELGKDWLKRIVVEGFADKRGSYLLNLNLSMQRSQRVLCVLLAKHDLGEAELSSQQQEDIRQLFLVGGYSSNSQKDTLEESRRIELRLEFRGIKEPSRTPPTTIEDSFGTCAL
ncbi:flagellar motor protein MotB [Methylovulum psychrotolerans]|uniref:Flagellar motor protein MotB n=1 Tax=Methylovulum psychrotolerans TaxID=1704499 RepID=A0A1Z4BW61_9GAMM|nr:flagellar motor protein MotB [Methylovulum psychrotolerans]ASF45480.1 flagellar motor protein MotB [Methylovulum psychrotolerans]